MGVVRKQRWWFGAALVVLLVAMGVTGLSCKRGNDAPPVPQGASQPAVVYTCSMHPEVLSDKPGNCPKCGMALVQRK